MIFELPEENSKRVLASVKSIANAGQNYLGSLSSNSARPTSSGKKLINALLLAPVIVPTAVTALSFGFTMLFLNAVSAQKNDSKLSKVAKGVARVLIWIVAAAILIPCILLNLITSTIPFLIFLAINKSMFSRKDIEKGEAQTISQMAINDSEEYNERVEAEVRRLGQYDAVCQPSDNQPNVEVISQVVEGEQAMDQTIMAKNINNDGIRDGEMIMQVIGDNDSLTIYGVFTGNATNKQESSATAMKLSCNIVEDGIDLQFGCSMRTGTDKKQAIERLRESESVHTLLSGNNGVLSIEHPGSSQQK